ncbi:glycerol kinase [Elusimicrobium simillimum]|uniref:FGGY family carbohydrate kinase n=1 Tax=Elusimicrobium simillimum TaxID=3143438 RepID=UPI003C704E94
MDKHKTLFAVLDQGSSGSRVFLVNERGEIVLKKHKEIVSKHLGLNLAEYDGQELLDSQLTLLKEALENLPNQVSSIAVTTQRSTIVLWDKTTGRAVAPVLTWQDGRGYKEAEAVAMPQEEIHKKTGLYKTPFYSASKITWCFNNIPAVKECAANGNLLIAPVATYIIWHLTGGKVFATDPTLAQRTLLFNINTFNWDDELLTAFGVPKECLPQIKNTYDDYGDYNGVPIKVCIGDQQSAAIGIGVANEGDAVINYGTGAFLLVNTGSNLRSIPGILTSVGATTAQQNRNFMLEGPVNAAAAIFQWLGGVGLSFDSTEIDDLFARAQKPIWFLPAFGGIGAPYWDFTTQTVMSGFTTATKKEDIVAGGVRSLGFMLADIVFYIKQHGINTGGIKVSGGFAKNHSLLKFQSDILQQKLIQTCESETTALGAVAIMAQHENIDIKLWDNFTSSREFTPQITPQEAQADYMAWRKFFDWCRSFK